ncbi:MAG TPA: plastocyanin/azurin family copper-binding protein [Longimicrobium sp.]|nr:plastocyanin/azurin family copper-binding protein [Longimicrobium sp.]
MAHIVLTAASLLVLAGCGGDAGTGSNPVTPQPVTPTPTSPTAPPAGSASVAAGSNSDEFSPAEVSVTVGGSVTWSFGARPHNVIFASRSGAPANIGVTNNSQVSRTFSTAGTFPYDCTLHAGMTGTVRVQ